MFDVVHKMLDYMDEHKTRYMSASCAALLFNRAVFQFLNSPQHEYIDFDQKRIPMILDGQFDIKFIFHFNNSKRINFFETIRLIPFSLNDLGWTKSRHTIDNWKISILWREEKNAMQNYYLWCLILTFWSESGLICRSESRLKLKSCRRISFTPPGWFLRLFWWFSIRSRLDCGLCS